MAQPAYDHTLLAAAPSLTRADRQAGYDVNALEGGSYYALFHTPAAAATTAAAVPPVADPFADQQRSYDPQPSREPSIQPKKPWYKTNRGRALIALIVIVFIGLLAGIAAGTAAARQSRNTTLLSNGTNSQNQDQSTSLTEATTSLIPSSSSHTGFNASPTPAGQEPTTFTFGNGNGATPTLVNGPNQGTTIVFGGTSSQPAIISPTQGTGSGGGNDNGGDIPLICYNFPQLRQCLPYFENGP